MAYVIKIDETGRAQYACLPEYAPSEGDTFIEVEELPDDNIVDYIYSSDRVNYDKHTDKSTSDNLLFLYCGDSTTNI